MPSNTPLSSSFGPSRLCHSWDRNCSRRDSLHPLVVRGSIPRNGLNVTMIYDSVVDKDRYECENIGGIMFSKLMVLQYGKPFIARVSTRFCTRTYTDSQMTKCSLGKSHDN